MSAFQPDGSVAIPPDAVIFSVVHPELGIILNPALPDDTFAALRAPTQSIERLETLLADPARLGSREILRLLPELRAEVRECAGITAVKRTDFRERSESGPFDISWRFSVTSSAYDPSVITGVFLGVEGFHLREGARIDRGFIESLENAIPPRPFYSPNFYLGLPAGATLRVSPEVSESLDTFLVCAPSSIYLMPFLKYHRGLQDGPQLTLFDQIRARTFDLDSREVELRLTRAATKDTSAVKSRFSISLQGEEISIANIGSEECWITVAHGNLDWRTPWRNCPVPEDRPIVVKN